jgi:hypothetical protein
MKIIWYRVRLSIAFVSLLTNPIFGEGFIAGTLIKTPIGHTPIERLKIDDKIIAYDQRKQKITESVVTDTHQIQAPDLVHLIAGSAILHAHKDQKFYIPDERKWYRAKDLKIGQCFLKDSKEHVPLTDIHNQQIASKLYNLTIKKHHTYLVSEQNIVAHNEAALLAIPAATKVGVLAPILAAYPLIAPITIAVGGLGLSVYVIWTLVDGFKNNKKSDASATSDTPNDSDKTKAADKPQEKGGTDPKKDGDDKKKDKDDKKENSKVKTPEDLIKDAKPGKDKKAKQFIKEGGYQEALKDFESLSPTEVKDMPRPKVGKLGILPDGRVINIREDSSAECPTIEIFPHVGSSDKTIKIRYGKPKY